MPVASEDSSPGIMPNVIAARIANYFDLHGLNMTVDTGTDSTLSAISIASDYIHADVLDVALVLGINGNSTPELAAVARPLLGPGKQKQLAEGAFLLACTRRSIAARTGLPVFAELKVSHFDSQDSVPMTHPVTTERSYLVGDSALAIIAASLTGGSTTIGSNDPVTGKRRIVTVVAAHSDEVHVALQGDAAGSGEAVETTVRPHALVLQESRPVPERDGVPAVPQDCLIVTNSTEILADIPFPPHVAVFSVAAEMLPVLTSGLAGKKICSMLSSD